VNNTTIQNLKELPYGGAQHVVSKELENFVANCINQVMSENVLQNSDIHNKFLSEYVLWINSSKKNTFIGLENFSVKAFSSGTTESFDKFYLKNLTRRLRYFKGEYMYHMVAGRQYFLKKSCFLEDDDLDKNDVVVISLPFSDTGNPHPDMEQVLLQCDRLDIPVLIDCAYFGICSGIIFNLNHKCITDLTFSLSKSFPVPHLRIGMRLTKTDDDDLLLVMNKTNYINRLSAGVGLKVIQRFTPDYIYEKYRLSQEKICKNLNVEPSSCVIFGIDKINQYPEYNRNAISNRLSFAKILDQ
jgi:hypothetical protein